MRCICHSAHLCASHACEKLPRTAEDLLHDVYNYFCHSAKRQSELQQFQYFTETEPHKLLRASQTRWLSLHSCVSRMIEQWDALLQYFQAATQKDNLLVTEKILSLMQNPIWKLYYYFLDFVLPKFNGLNLMFQSSKVSIHCLHASFVAIYKEFLSCYMKEAYWKQTPLQNIDPASTVNLLPLTSMYMGTKIALCLPLQLYMSRAPDVQYFLKKVQEFYIEAASQIKRIRQLTLKSAMSMCLTRPSRSADLSKLDLSTRSYTYNGVMFQPTHLSKQSRPSKAIANFLFPSFPSDRKICPVTSLRDYEERTASYRKDQSNSYLFLSLIGKHSPVSSSTITRWL